ncbi:hypothetical protein [Capnocytophaga stomatis]|uniref:hypothetical protein n=1 Tax=Capnocytophaga stomatis TaxID=1848904 RepID=UPI001AC8EEFB|nr:hypothetical protein [Capnocytophaga stomatis]GIM50581.1 hypothetical protein CAPN003_20330 [Capnocytophaga stomatis]
MPGTDNLNNDFTQEEKDLFDAHLSSTEAQKVEQEQEEELQAQQDKLIVVDGARYRFGAHLAELKVLNDTPTIQGKLVGTVVENQPTNFTFADGFQLTSLGPWTGQGTAKFQNNEVLIQGSKITFTGQMPGSNTVETGTARCIHSGQINVVESIDTAFGPFPPYKTPPKILSGWWSEDKNGLRDITQAALEDTVYFVIETAHIADGEKLSVQLYDYDCFMWVDFLNRDDKIENPKQVRVKNNRAVIEVYLKPEWKKHIDDDKGYAFNLDESVDLYWEVRHDKAKTKTLPTNEKAYLKVKNNRTIYIKPVMSETGYNYGVPEVYTFEGEPFPFEEIFDVQAIDENSGDLFKEYGKGLLISGALYTGDKGLSKAAKGIALRKIAKGYRVNNAGKMLYHDYFTFMKEERMLRTFLPAEMRSLRGIDQVSTMQKKLASTQTLHFIRNATNIYGNFASLVDLAAGGKDVNAVAADALAFAVRATPVVGILLSTFAKMTLDVMQTPVKDVIMDWQKDDSKWVNSKKTEGIDELKKSIKYGNDNVMFFKKYFFKEISFQSMQKLLNGSVKRWENLDCVYNEVSILCVEVEEGVFVVDSFFVNTEKM